MNTSILGAFRNRLQGWADANGAEISRPLGSNILCVTGPMNRHLYVKVRSQPPGFWGLTATRLHDLDARDRNWCAVLLLASSEAGYCVPVQAVRERIARQQWRLAGDGDYKVYEGSSLDPAYRFRGFLELISRVAT